MSTACIMLNGDYSFLGLVDWKKAMCLVVAEKVKVLKYSDRLIRSVDKVFKAPAVIVLIKVVRSVYRNRVPFNKKNVLIRDRYACVYCGRKEKALTIDHVIPQSRGGATDFDNCVACCRLCNTRKGARTPNEAHMPMRRRAYQPTIAEFIQMRLRQSGVYRILVELGIYG